MLRCAQKNEKYAPAWGVSLIYGARMRLDRNNPIEVVAFEMIKNSYPQHLQESYELHMTADYSAPSYIYVLQELAAVLSGIGIGVLSNMVYAKIQSSKTISKDDMSELLLEYKKTVKELKEAVEEHQKELKREYHSYRIQEIGPECLDEIRYHEGMALRLQEEDPETIFSVNEALAELEKYSNKN